MILPETKNTRLCLVTALLAVSGAGMSFPLNAQPAALEEVIVTATRRDESLQEVPIMVNAFSAEVIQEAGIQNANDIATLTPSLSINTNTTPFTAAFRIRGIGTSQSDIALELRNRDRERKLIKKINETIARIDSEDYGYCESCGVEIGLERLQARPTATLCIECKTLEEIRERQVAKS